MLLMVLSYPSQKKTKKCRPSLHFSLGRSSLGIGNKATLSHSDCLVVQNLLKRLEELCTKFREYHYAAIDQTEQENNLEKEQVIMGDHEDKIAELVERIQELEAESPLTARLSTPDAKMSHHLRRRLNDMERNLCLAKEEIEPLTSGSGVDSYLLLQLEEQVGSLKIYLLEVTRDILSSDKEEEDLSDQKDRLRKALFDVSLQIECLLHNQPSSPSVLENDSGVKLPKRDVPAFHGKIIY